MARQHCMANTPRRRAVHASTFQLPLALPSAQVWSVVRGRGKRLPQGGTLVVGREQDCEGGCFDSDPGGRCVRCGMSGGGGKGAACMGGSGGHPVHAGRRPMLDGKPGPRVGAPSAPAASRLPAPRRVASAGSAAAPPLMRPRHAHLVVLYPPACRSCGGHPGGLAAGVRLSG